MRVTRGAVAGALLAGLVLVPGAPAHADAVDCTGTTADTPAPSSTTDPSLPLEALGIEETHAWLAAHGSQRPGAGVRVAVVDSGIAPRAVGSGIPVAPEAYGRGEVVDAHGTIVAGIVAGSPRTGPDGQELPVGIAPAAEVVDVRVYDSGDPAEGEDPVEPPNVVAGLQWVAQNAERLGIGVVNVSLAMPRYAPLKKVLRRLEAADVVVVAASGNRPREEGDFLYEELGPEPDESAEGGEEAPATGPRPGEDARGLVWPAAYPGVVAVSSTADGTGAGDATGEVLLSSDIDVAVPTFGAISYGLDGGTCGVPGYATSWSAAVVSGVVALLRSHHDDENAAQIVSRLLGTASASTEQPNVHTGAGVVQPLEALARPLRPRKQDGALEVATSDDRAVERATAPPEEVDLLAGARDRAVWWGLIGGGALLLALVLRPVLARRRP
ncbi:S8 family serine peptidase [Nocardioides sp. SOB77]|uniref:S8 family serine peptidase n=1 Tax=Nocardioides oceani TaxID=3058369 RepID=A0ABT8FBM0_9ACTN|nr:S8 family serine peptidase [Nocardioides oceani]MDN4171974.1 S8 family serine peptidase [Nocardioides oceani]